MENTTTFTIYTKKFIIQIIPTFIFFTIYVILFNHPFIESINHIYKRGYWFTIALFEYFLFQYI